MRATLALVVAGTLLGCGVTEEECAEDHDLCVADCVDVDCLAACEEVYEGCTAGAQSDGDDVQTFLEILDLLLGGDEDDG